MQQRNIWSLMGNIKEHTHACIVISARHCAAHSSCRFYCPRDLGAVKPVLRLTKVNTHVFVSSGCLVDAQTQDEREAEAKASETARAAKAGEAEKAQQMEKAKEELARLMAKAKEQADAEDGAAVAKAAGAGNDETASAKGGVKLPCGMCGRLPNSLVQAMFQMLGSAHVSVCPARVRSSCEGSLMRNCAMPA